MFKDFWEAKKHLIQFIGILAGIGALFLAIPKPDNVKAGVALAHIQFIWLIILSISVVVLFIHFLGLVVKWEKEFDKKSGFDLTETISMIVSLTVIYLISNLWIYMINVYKDSLFDFMKSTSFAASSTIAAFLFAVNKKIVVKVPEKYKIARTMLSLVVLGTISLTVSAWITFIQSPSSFSILQWMTFFVATFLVLILFWLVVEFKKLYKKPS